MGDQKIQKVILVGAGPGDPGLITVRGLDAIQNADILIYDYLASAELVAEAHKAEKIYVGKTGRVHTLEQDDINALLVEKAKSGGGLVVRLKGGDPYIFGRGSEEAEYCRNHGVEVEVIPGIPAAIGAGAYAGVPLTDRRFTSSLFFVTGHEDPNKLESSIDWDALVRSKATLVFYMGVKNLPGITGKLIENGMTGDTPVAIVQWATTTRQRLVKATLADAAAVAVKENVKAPAITIVGGVASMSDQLGWFQSLPFFGKSVVVTRTRAQASSLVKSLRELGANIIETPTIAIAPPPSWQPLDDAISNIKNYNWVVFTSVNAVDYFMERLAASGKDARALAGILLGAIGPATADRLKAFALNMDFVAEKFVGEYVAKGMIEKFGVSGKKILLPRSEAARPELPDLLKQAGADVREVQAYMTVLPDTDVSELKKQIEENCIDYITFTSSSTATNFVELLGKNFVDSNKDKFKAASIGPITSETLRGLGIEPVVEAEQYTIPGLVDAMLNLISQTKVSE